MCVCVCQLNVLSFLGETQESLSMSFRIGQNTISGIIREVCAALVIFLKDDFLRFPTSEDEWRVVAHEFGEKWNFYNCVGAMDGKHVKIDCPLKSGSLYYNYKDEFSIVLLAVVDANLTFIYIDVGINGRISDSGVWNKSSLKAKLDNNSIKFPKASFLSDTDVPFPFMLVDDEGFLLTTTLLILYPGAQRRRNDRRIFNYRYTFLRF